jgi:hypothetical protein
MVTSNVSTRRLHWFEAGWTEKAAYLALKFDLLFILHPKSVLCLQSQTSTMQLTLYGAYHLANRVFPLRSKTC